LHCQPCSPRKAGSAMSRYEEKRRFFDETAPQWAHGAFDEDERPIAEWIVREAGIGAGMVVLEPGCGAGRMTRLLAEAVGPAGRVMACDISEKMVEAARRNAAAENVRVYHGAAEDLDLPRRSVDVVLCFDVFPHFEEPADVLGVFRSILRPQGKLVIAHCPGRREVNERHRQAGHAVGADRLPEADAMRSLLKARGFAVERLIDEADRYYLVAGLPPGYSAPARA